MNGQDVRGLPEPPACSTARGQHEGRDSDTTLPHPTSFASSLALATFMAPLRQRARFSTSSCPGIGFRRQSDRFAKCWFTGRQYRHPGSMVYRTAPPPSTFPRARVAIVRWKRERTTSPIPRPASSSSTGASTIAISTRTRLSLPCGVSTAVPMNRSISTVAGSRAASIYFKTTG